MLHVSIYHNELVIPSYVNMNLNSENSSL